MKIFLQYSIIFLVIIISPLFVLYIFRNEIMPILFIPRTQITPTPQTSLTQTPINSPTTQPVATESKNDIKIIATQLHIPWEIAFLPDGDMLVTERAGTLLKVGSETKIITKISGVAHIGEGGLLGLALHPRFSQNHFIYLYSTTEDSHGVTNRVERYTFSQDSLRDRTVILEGIKGSSNHDGGRIAFGPDGYLYITTGDAESPNLAQDTKSLNGKILRIKDDGSIPTDNPFRNAVYSVGHRNPQGLTWDEHGTLWETEHGPSGLQTGYDEVNIITKGANYGWPIIKGDQVKEGFVSPVVQSGSRDTWAPSGLTYKQGNLFFSGLRGEALYQLNIGNGNKRSVLPHFKQQFGRIRAVVVGPDGYLYITTSNTDGRGQIRKDDDKIIKINPQIFQ